MNREREKNVDGYVTSAIHRHPVRYLYDAPIYQQWMTEGTRD